MDDNKQWSMVVDNSGKWSIMINDGKWWSTIIDNIDDCQWWWVEIKTYWRKDEQNSLFIWQKYLKE